MRLVDCEQGTPEWHLARAGVATASCFADIMAKLKTGGEAAVRRNYRTGLVVERLTGRPLPDSYQNDAMRLGIEREPDARRAYERRTRALVDQVGLCLHDTLMAGASPDGLIDDDPDGEGGLEIKCPGLAKHLEYIHLAAEPAEYTWQIQGGMWITGRKWWDFVSFNPEFPEHLQLVVRRIPRNDLLIKALDAEVTTFLKEVDAEVKRLMKAHPIAA